MSFHSNYPTKSQTTDSRESGKETPSFFSWDVQGETFQLDKQYTVTDYLGRGAYGVVCTVRKTLETGDAELFAMKKCMKVFDSLTLAKRTLREIRYLRFLNHDNIVKIQSVEIPLSLSSFNDVYVLYELMDTDLSSIIHSQQEITERHMKCFTFQILTGLEYLHAKHIVHRDLKPMNILINSNCFIKLADFGLSKLCTDNNVSKIPPMTGYVTTRWYRAPEVLVGWNSYTYPIDLWAVGTIVAEMLLRKPMFCGKDSTDQLEMIVGYCGVPSESFVKMCKKNHVRRFLSSLQPPIPRSSRKYLHDRQPKRHRLSKSQWPDEDYGSRGCRIRFQNASKDVLELLRNLLQMDPGDRLTAAGALQLPFFEDAQDMIPRYRRGNASEAGSPHSMSSFSLASTTSMSSTSGSGSDFTSEWKARRQTNEVIPIDHNNTNRQCDIPPNNHTTTPSDRRVKAKQISPGHRRGWGWTEQPRLVLPLPQKDFLFETRHPGYSHKSKRSVQPKCDFSCMSATERGVLHRNQLKQADDAMKREREKLEELQELRAEVLIEVQHYHPQICVQFLPHEQHEALVSRMTVGQPLCASSPMGFKLDTAFTTPLRIPSADNNKKPRLLNEDGGLKWRRAESYHGGVDARSDESLTPSSDSLSLIEMNLYPDSISPPHPPISTLSDNKDHASLRCIEMEELFALLNPGGFNPDNRIAPESHANTHGTRSRSLSFSLSSLDMKGVENTGRASLTGCTGNRPTTTTTRRRSVSLPEACVSPPLRIFRKSSPSASAVAVTAIETTAQLATATSHFIPLNSPDVSTSLTSQSYKSQQQSCYTSSRLPPAAPRSPSPSPSPSPLQREHIDQMSRVLSQYSVDSFRGWKGAVRSQSQDDEFDGNTLRTLSDLSTRRRVNSYGSSEQIYSHTQFQSQELSTNMQFRGSFMSPLGLLRKKCPNVDRKLSPFATGGAGMKKMDQFGPDVDMDVEWRSRCRAMSGEHGQLSDWVSQMDDKTSKVPCDMAILRSTKKETRSESLHTSLEDKRGKFSCTIM